MVQRLAWLVCPLLCLPLLFLLWPLQKPLEAPPPAKEVVTVWAPGEVRGFLGDTVKLPCNLRFPESKPQNVTQITWKRWAPLIEPSVVAVLHPLYGPRILESGHVMFTAAEWGHNLLDASLSVHRLHPEDDANYTCEITTLQEGSYSATTWLRVFYAPQVFISRSNTTGQQGHYETTLTCNARGNPEPKSYDWNTTTGSLPPSAVPQGSRLLIQHTEESINVTFICHVSNDLGTGQAAMRVEFPEAKSPEPINEEPSSLLKTSFKFGITLLIATVIIRASVNKHPKLNAPEFPHLKHSPFNHQL